MAPPGQLLLRILYRRPPPPTYMRGFAGLVRGGCVADVGGGSGWLYDFLGPVACYLLIDVDEELVRVGVERLRGSRHVVEAVVADAHSLPLRSGCCSVVLHDALHHFNEPWAAAEEAAQLLTRTTVG